MSPNRLKHRQDNAKSRAINSELARLIGDPDCRPYRGGHYEFGFHPMVVIGNDEDGKRVTSKYSGGPQTKTVQWEATNK